MDVHVPACIRDGPALTLEPVAGNLLHSGASGRDQDNQGQADGIECGLRFRAVPRSPGSRDGSPVAQRQGPARAGVSPPTISQAQSFLVMPWQPIVVRTRIDSKDDGQQLDRSRFQLYGHGLKQYLQDGLLLITLSSRAADDFMRALLLDQELLMYICGLLGCMGQRTNEIRACLRRMGLHCRNCA